MPTFSSNRKDVVQAIRELADTMRFGRKPGGSRETVGKQILDCTAAIIETRTINEQRDPEGNPLARLKPYTLEQKAKKGYPATISVMTGEMTSTVELRGKQQVGDSTASMAQGTNPQSQAKAGWFTEGGDNQEPRPFYDLGSTGEPLLEGYIEREIIEPHIREVG
jgi:hypothetical protein